MSIKIRESVKKYVANVRRSNSKFAKMSTAEKRVAIAKDVIKALNIKFLKSTPMSYLRINNREVLEKLYDNEAGSFQDSLLDGKVPSCDVCAKGAIFTCAVMRQNNATNEDAISSFPADGEDLSPTLKGIFTPSQLDLIENYFEADKSNGESTDPYYRKLNGLEPKKRLELIMQNIIDNKGTFKPGLLPNHKCTFNKEKS